MHWNDLQKTFPLSYYTSKSQQAENYLVLPIKLMINRFKSQSATDHQIIMCSYFKKYKTKYFNIIIVNRLKNLPSKIYYIIAFLITKYKKEED